jgi:hypothetical protein
MGMAMLSSHVRAHGHRPRLYNGGVLINLSRHHPDGLNPVGNVSACFARRLQFKLTGTESCAIPS